MRRAAIPFVPSFPAFALLWPLSFIANPSLADEAGSRVPEDAIQTVSATHLRISYETPPDAPPPSAAELWYTTDAGRSWRLYVRSTEDLNPIRFQADREGLCGFVVLLSDDPASPAGPPPPGTKAQQWVHVDRSPPSARILNLQIDQRFEINREVNIRWIARDENLPDRPVSLHYRAESAGSYNLIAEQLPAEGSLRWTVPPGLSGRLDVKLTAVDKAGQRGLHVADWLRLGGPRAVPATEPAGADEPALAGASADLANAEGRSPARIGVNPITPRRSDPRESRHVPGTGRTAEPGPDEDAVEAHRLYEIATWHRLRGEHLDAITRYRESLERDPSLSASRHDLAGVLLLRGDYDEAAAQYRLVLETDPGHTGALKGLALACVKRHNYASARQALEKLVAEAPRDAEGWLYLGDVALFVGDRRAASTAWTTAAKLAADGRIRSRAEKRLSLYAENRPTGPHAPGRDSE